MARLAADLFRSTSKSARHKVARRNLRAFHTRYMPQRGGGDDGKIDKVNRWCRRNVRDMRAKCAVEVNYVSILCGKRGVRGGDHTRSVSTLNTSGHVAFRHSDPFLSLQIIGHLVERDKIEVRRSVEV